MAGDHLQRPCAIAFDGEDAIAARPHRIERGTAAAAPVDAYPYRMCGTCGGLGREDLYDHRNSRFSGQIVTCGRCGGSGRLPA